MPGVPDGRLPQRRRGSSQRCAGHHRPDHHSRLINVDFADVKGIMSSAGTALMGIGPLVATAARSRPPRSPSTPHCWKPDGRCAGRADVHAGGSDLGLFEINEAASLVQESAHADANIIFGTVIDDSLGDEVRVTVIAAGFDTRAPAVSRSPGCAGVDGDRCLGRQPIAAARAGKVSSSLFDPIETMSSPGAHERRDGQCRRR